ncbi:MlaA family lipoprotein [Lysobacter sp. 22409]|uniref:MlaA family lipoprotein n=1 Tax=Lysobacter sp. 22409 TaxID=3453917 RepID=UPI003F83D0C0
MRPHALSLSLGLALAALHSVPAFAQDANPASVAEAAVVSATAQTDAALATAPTETLAPADAATTPVDTTQAATAEPALDYALAQVETSQVQPAQPDPNAPAAEAVLPPATAAVEPSAADDQRTEAERDFDALYGTPAQEYDPVADPTLPAPASVPGAFDPWEKYNRKMHRFNMAVDRGVARPLARAYSKVVPRPVRLGVSNFFNNLGQPVSILNALLQGKPKQAAQALGRFALNTTLGIGGIFDPASDAKLPNRSEDFGQTLGVWGWKRSRYVELPFFGPRTVRDSFGALGDAPLSPLRHVERDRIRIPLQGLQLVDVRAQLLPLDSLRDGAEDEYALVRDSWTQRRDYQIFGDRLDKNGDSALPEYLQDDSNPSVPADAMPVMPTDGGR